MTTDEIVAGLDRSLKAIAAERQRLVAARTQLTGAPAAAEPSGAQRKPQRRSRRKRGNATQQILDGLDPAQPRTAGDLEKLTGVGRALAGTTLNRLVKQGLASKAERGYLRAGA